MKINVKDIIIVCGIVFSGIQNQILHYKFKSKIDEIKIELLLKIDRLHLEMDRSKEILNKKIKGVKNKTEDLSVNDLNVDSISYHIDVALVIKYVLIVGAVGVVFYYTLPYIKAVSSILGGISGTVVKVGEVASKGAKNVNDVIDKAGETISNASTHVTSDLSNLSDNLNNLGENVNNFTSNLVNDIPILNNITTVVDLTKIGDGQMIFPDDSISKSCVDFQGIDPEKAVEIAKNLFN